MSSVRGAWTGAALMAGVLGAFLFVGRAKADEPAPFTPQIRKVTVGENNYTVVALGQGTFQVFESGNPGTMIVFGDGGITQRSGSTAIMERDMQRFPGDLFR